MASSTPENRAAVSVANLLITSMISLVLCVGSAECAQTLDAQQNSSDESWTATTQISVANTNPSRTTESYSKSGNRSVDTQRVEVLGFDGRYRPDSETETETVRVNDTTMRTVVRTYRWDGNGQRKLAQLTEEEARSTASGDGQAIRTTSSADLNGNLQIVKREITGRRNTSPDAQETRTKVYLADGNGGFTMALQTQELQMRTDDHRVEVKKTMLLQDGNGNWKVGEVKETTIKENGKNRTIEERISRPDLEGRLSAFSRTVGEEAENSAGERNNTVDTYSKYVPGSTDDGSMHWTQKVTTLQKKDSGGETTEQRVEQPNPGNPSDGPQVSAKTTYTVRYSASGSDKTKTIQAPDGNGNFKMFYVETRKSDQVPPAQIPRAPADKLQ